MRKFLDLGLSGPYATIWGVDGFQTEYASRLGDGWVTTRTSYPPSGEVSGWERYLEAGFSVWKAK